MAWFIQSSSLQSSVHVIFITSLIFSTSAISASIHLSNPAHSPPHGQSMQPPCICEPLQCISSLCHCISSIYTWRVNSQLIWHFAINYTQKNTFVHELEQTSTMNLYILNDIMIFSTRSVGELMMKIYGQIIKYLLQYIFSLSPTGWGPPF